MGLDLAGVQVLFDLLGDGLSHAGNGLQLSFPADLLHIFLQGLNGTSSFAVGDDLETILGMQLQQLCHLVEDCCDILIFHEIDLVFRGQENFGQFG